MGDAEEESISTISSGSEEEEELREVVAVVIDEEGNVYTYTGRVYGAWSEVVNRDGHAVCFNAQRGLLVGAAEFLAPGPSAKQSYLSQHAHEQVREPRAGAQPARRGGAVLDEPARPTATTRLPLLAAVDSAGGKIMLKRFIEVVRGADTNGLPVLLTPAFHRLLSELAATLDASTAEALCKRLYLQLRDPSDEMKRIMLGWLPEASPTREADANASHHSGGSDAFYDPLSFAHQSIQGQTPIVREVLYSALAFDYAHSAMQHRASEIAAMRQRRDRIHLECKRAEALEAQRRTQRTRVRRQRRKTHAARQRECAAPDEVREQESDNGSRAASLPPALRVWKLVIVALAALAVVLGVAAALAFTSSGGSPWGGSAASTAPRVNASTHEVERQSAETYIQHRAGGLREVQFSETDAVRIPLALCEEVRYTCGHAARSIACLAIPSPEVLHSLGGSRPRSFLALHSAVCGTIFYFFFLSRRSLVSRS